MKRVLFLLMLWATPLMAVQPEEVLEDPVLEERARDLSKELRCLVCRNESIDESNADLARDLRLLVRERLVAGDTDEQVIAFVVARYGEYVLLRPQTGGANAILWLAGPALLILALLTGMLYIRSRSRQEAPTKGLNTTEEARLKELLDE